jgi:hypothetical protein
MTTQQLSFMIICANENTLKFQCLKLFRYELYTPFIFLRCTTEGINDPCQEIFMSHSTHIVRPTRRLCTSSTLYTCNYPQSTHISPISYTLILSNFLPKCWSVKIFAGTIPLWNWPYHQWLHLIILSKLILHLFFLYIFLHNLFCNRTTHMITS